MYKILDIMDSEKELKNNEGQINSLQQEIDILTLELTNREVSLGTLQLKKVLEIIRSSKVIYRRCC